MHILLDQGFGAWKIKGIARHDFKAIPEVQAEAIRSSSYEVLMAEGDGMPVVIESR
jgi:hypothetical protein